MGIQTYNMWKDRELIYGRIGTKKVVHRLPWAQSRGSAETP